MKIRDTEFKIIQQDIFQLKVEGIVCPSQQTSVQKVKKGKAKYLIYVSTCDADGNSDEDSIRLSCADALERARALKIKSLAFPLMSSEKTLVPFVGIAKIMTQEVLKFIKTYPKVIPQIVFCLNQKKNFMLFKKTVSSYIYHLENDLSKGPFVTVDVIIELPEGIVLIERSNPPYGWALPGGFIDYGESLEEAVRREAKEETNLELDKLRQFHTYSLPLRDPRFHTISTVFIARGKGTPKSGDDAKSFQVVSPGELLTLKYAFDHGEIIKDYLDRRNILKGLF